VVAAAKGSKDAWPAQNGNEDCSADAGWLPCVEINENADPLDATGGVALAEADKNEKADPVDATGGVALAEADKNEKADPVDATGAVLCGAACGLKNASSNRLHSAAGAFAWTCAGIEVAGASKASSSSKFTIGAAGLACTGGACTGGALGAVVWLAEGCRAGVGAAGSPVLIHSFLSYALVTKAFFMSMWLSGLGRMLSGQLPSHWCAAARLPPRFCSMRDWTSIMFQLLMLTLLHRCEKA